MQTLEIKIYEYSDLIKPENSNVIENIISKWEIIEDHLHSDAAKTIEKFKKYVPETFDYDDEISGLRLRTWIINNIYPDLEQGKYYCSPGTWIDGKYQYRGRYSNITNGISCPFTGMCYDMAILEPIIDFVNRPSTHVLWEELYTDCFVSLDTAIGKELEYLGTQEAILEDIEANEYAFQEDGTLINI